MSPQSAGFALSTALLDQDAPAAGSSVRLSSNLATFFNLINNYVGMVLLSMHFCLAKSGWLGLMELALLTMFGAFTGDCLVQAYQLVERDNPSRSPSYAEIGDRCLGAFGRWLVVVSSMIENFVAILCMLIIIWENGALLLPGVAKHWVIGGCIALSFPANYLRDFTLLSFLSAFGLGCILLILAVVLFDATAAVLNPLTPTGQQELAIIGGLPMSGSIMLAGLTGHVGLPPMYAEMKTPSAFRPTLYLSFFAMFAMYAVVGAGGYVLYGEGASILITTDMAAAASEGESHWVSQLLTYLVLGGITFKLFAGIPICIVVQVDIMKDLYQEVHGQVLSEAAVDRMRLGVWAGTVVCALAFLPWLQYVTALVGINSMLISVILPLVFYVQLHRHTMTMPTLCVYVAMVACSLVGVAFVSYADVIDFLETLQAAGPRR